MDLDLIILFLQQGIVSGLVIGSVYALLALSIVMIFKTSEVPNFAAGEVFMAAAYCALFLLVFQKLPIWLAIPATLAISFVVAAIFRRSVLTQVAKASGSPVNLVIATLGLSYVLKGLVRRTGYGDTPRSFPALVSTDSLMIGQASVTRLDLAIFIAAIGRLRSSAMGWRRASRRTLNCSISRSSACASSRRKPRPIASSAARASASRRSC